MPLHAIEQHAGLPIVWASPREVVVWKPPGIASELSNDTKAASALERVRRAGFARARLPHRLDRIARGLLLIALDDESIAHHNAQIQQHQWGKWYLARLELRPGLVAPDLVGEHRAHLKRKGAKAELVRSGGQPARLGVLACERCTHPATSPHPMRTMPGPTPADALIQLHTGRFHQIRAMMAGLGAPLQGDALYNPSAPNAPNAASSAGSRPRDADAYLEHFALRFTPCGQGEPVFIDAASHGHRPKIAPGVWSMAQSLAP